MRVHRKRPSTRPSLALASVSGHRDSQRFHGIRLLRRRTAMLLLLLGQAPLVIGVFILVFGASQGAATLARPSILAEHYGTSHYGRISSVMAIFLTLTSTSAPLGASLFYDRFQTYQPVLWIVLVLALAATGVVVLAKRHMPRNQTTPLVEGEPIIPPIVE
jgi:hypothetical protein